MIRLTRTLGLLLGLLPLVAGALDIDGPRRQGGLLHGEAPPGAEVRALGHTVPVDSAGRFVLGLGRDAPAVVTVTAVSPDGTRRQRTLEVAQRRYDIQRIDGLDRNQVSPDAETLERIRRDASAVRAARARRLPARHFDAGWIWPVTGPISGIYGSQRILNGEPRQPHYGIDIARPTGTPVRAPSDGVVTLAAEDLFFSGGTLILDHGQGLSSSFLHLSAMRVAVGDTVRQGEIIAEVGASGRVTGAHLDWRMNWFDQRIDPSMLVPPMTEASTQ
ncbi:M23 family metallopeptidase [Spiribacter aquaticus]|jgi:murein DD-endopeptidase MepM/ murein hydrolase activator NlpD|uniref:M23 family metallopeptidase n=1 Tax=Spiribacter aquaticus TaxID=1935996 RepID=A0A557RHG8_9GAMM|nr:MULTISPECIES: M23 family metallopeptidase [Spiribacter]KAF0280660.1 peptidase [Spiribacter roseus]TVO64588.1 M23 family metallopeptidase [Spiribacter aquaticus]